MSFEQTRFTIMALPQRVDADGNLSINIVFIPRNISPLRDVKTIFNAANSAPAFVDVQPEFDIMVVNNPNEFPGKIPANEKALAPDAIQYSSIQAEIYKTLKHATNADGTPKYFDIDESRSTDVNPNSDHTAPKVAAKRDLAIRKYLPQSYRKAFNFTSPRLKNAVTDDSYHCAMRDQTPKKPFKEDKQISWGKVYAHLLRQPLMAKQAGLIYETSVKIDFADFEKGGWIYVDIKKDTRYYDEQQASLSHPQGPFIKRYAARIPMLKKGEARNLFAAILFPVVKVGDSPVGVYDDLYIEAAKFNEGFATIVHANQPVSGNLLQEEQDGFHPQKDLGIRLGWEDEQILEWYLRQMAIDESTGDRLDAPLGVMGYQVDVKKREDDDASWESLTAVESNGNMNLEGIDIGAFKGEMPYQVYPTKVYDGTTDTNNYWLPMYFANWANSSLVLPDKIAAEIYQNRNEKNKPVQLSDTYKAQTINTKLQYGNAYDFRVRLSDISGGTPSPKTPTLKDLSISHVARTTFKRYVAPHAVTIVNSDAIRSNTDDLNFNDSSLILSRPLLGYPAVLYTGKYTDPVGRLAKSVQDILDLQVSSVGKQGANAFGIPDPDITSIEIKVEVETLNLDNLASEDGREHFIVLYKTTRVFEAFNENKADANIEVPIVFKDVDVLNLTDTLHPFPEANDNDCITAASGAIILPTARNIRITMRAVGDANADYWGIENIANTKLDSRFGKQTVIHMREESKSEENIFINTEDPQTLQGIYLQPDPVTVKLDPIFFKTLHGGNEGMPDIVHRLGAQLNVAVNGLTLLAENGERLQFWCGNLLRHSMAPDNSSITFANKLELQDHWLVATTLYIHRDWTWDSLDASSFYINRKRRLGRDPKSILEKEYEFIGDLELKKTASFQAIQKGKDGKVHREYTRIILIDVVDNKPADGQLPDIVELQYSITPKFRNGHTPQVDTDFETLPLVLPTTSNPTQTPKLIAAGIALSPYNRNVTYSTTEARTRFLWLEFDKKPIDDNDTIFCRKLAYSPDQLISNNHPSLLDIPTESSLPIDPEYIRVVTPSSGHDHNGLNAMQPMEKSIVSGRHFYLLPLPPGLHHESAELFGMFTYEFRYGHTDKIWSTAQGRFGRALRVAGLQHPAPTLNCMVNRNEKEVTVNAPFAQAVMNGKNVTSNPPKTSLWALLYAQVKQADGLDYRNILLDELELIPKPIRKRGRMAEEIQQEIELQAQRDKDLGIQPIEFTNEMLEMNISQQMAWEKEVIRQGYGSWKNADIVEMLELYGLPSDSSLSVICVEVYGQVTNAHEHINQFDRVKDELIDKTETVFDHQIAQAYERTLKEVTNDVGEKNLDPLNSQLGLHRILRTSPLTEVPFVCCTDC